MKDMRENLQRETDGDRIRICGPSTSILMLISFPSSLEMETNKLLRVEDM